MIERNVEISGRNAKNLYEFVCMHNLALDGLRLGQRFVKIYIYNPWPELFYEKCDDKACCIIGNYLLDNQYSDTMPEPLKIMIVK